MSGLAAPRPMSSAPKQPGAALRRVRERSGLTLGEVSRRTGIPVSTLSKVENGKLSLSYRRLAQLSDGLEIDVARLFEAPGGAPAREAPATGRRSVRRAGDPGGPCAAADLLHTRLSPQIATLDPLPAGAAPRLVRLTGEIFAYVIEGEAELHTDLYAPLPLGPGDSIYFDGATAHAWIGLGPGVCRVLTVSSCDEGQTPPGP